MSPGSFLYSLFSALLSPFIHSAHLSGIAPISLTDSKPAPSHSRNPFPQGSVRQHWIPISLLKTQATSRKSHRKKVTHLNKRLSLFTRKRGKLELTLKLPSFSELLWAVRLPRAIPFVVLLLFWSRSESPREINQSAVCKSHYTPQMTLVFPNSR